MNFTNNQVNAALNQPMGENDAGASTIREYLKELLSTLWSEGEGFSGKRPFGNSCWEYEIYKALVAGEHIEGELDENGWPEDFDDKTGNALVFAMIDRVFAPSKESIEKQFVESTVEKAVALLHSVGVTGDQAEAFVMDGVPLEGV